MAAIRSDIKQLTGGPEDPHAPTAMKADGSPVGTIQRQCRRASANNVLDSHFGIAGPVPPVVGGAAWCLRTSLDFNEDSPKRNAESRRATMVAQAHLMQQATARDVLMLTSGLSRWKLSRTAAGGDHAVMCRVESGRDFRLQWWHGLRVVPSKIGASATTEALASEPGRRGVEPSHARLRFAPRPSRAWARIYSDPSTHGVDLRIWQGC